MERKRHRSKNIPIGYSKKRRKRSSSIFYAILIIVVFLAAITLASSLLLKVSLVMVSGSSVYSQEEILDACTVKPGDNLVVADTDLAEAEIVKKLPYIKKAVVSKKFPSKILVSVEGNEAMFAFSQGGVYILLDENFKVLENKEQLPENTCVIKGALLFEPVQGEISKYLNEDTKKTVETVLIEMKNCEYDFSKITSISFEDERNISYVYENRIKVVLGQPIDLSYKLTFSRSILLNEDGAGLSADEIGIFDITLASDTNRGIFKKLDSLGEEAEEGTTEPGNAPNGESEESAAEEQPEQSGAD